MWEIVAALVGLVSLILTIILEQRKIRAMLNTQSGRALLTFVKTLVSILGGACFPFIPVFIILLWMFDGPNFPDVIDFLLVLLLGGGFICGTAYLRKQSWHVILAYWAIGVLVTYCMYSYLYHELLINSLVSSHR